MDFSTSFPRPFPTRCLRRLPLRDRRCRNRCMCDWSSCRSCRLWRWCDGTSWLRGIWRSSCRNSSCNCRLAYDWCNRCFWCRSWRSRLFSLLFWVSWDLFSSRWLSFFIFWSSFSDLSWNLNFSSSLLLLLAEDIFWSIGDTLFLWTLRLSEFI